ncbi:hypothetical protein ACQPYH_28670 [Kribbella sp. CA-245084]|uniref:hypothetical protein n=1 Tax=Kribbella sp. CA-245084 TaxID=3239940 RepID=UPI003D94D171
MSLVVALVFGSPFGSNEAGPDPQITVTVTESTSDRPPEPTDISSETPSGAPSSVEPPDPVETTPGVLPPEATGKPLQLESFFKYPDGWRDGRYDIADRKQVAGIAGQLQSCGQDNGQTLELRLANNFTRLRFDFAQSNTSESSDQVLQVRIDANGAFRGQRSVKLNQIGTVDVVVSGVNALKLTVSLKESPACGSGSVEAVLANILLT